MKTALRCVLPLLVFMFFAPNIGGAQERPFTAEGLEEGAREYEDYLRQSWSAQGSDAKGWLAKGAAALRAQDPRRATGAFASAVMLDGANADVWLALSKAYASIETSDTGEKSSFQRSASSTAYIAYTRAKTAPVKAAALAELAGSLAKRSLWRTALDAYKASLRLADAAPVRAAYEQLRAEQGFRMLDYSVDSEAAAPRLCVQFSEPLAKGESDFGKFLTLNGAAAPSVKADERQLCIEELLHGRRYEVKLRSGLPSIIADEPLAKPVDLTVYVRDRKPLARFSGRNYVLPRTGQQGIPVTTVNTSAVKIAIYFIGDRSLANEVIGGDFAQAIAEYRAEQIRDAKGEKLWSGDMPVKSALNEETVTAFPVGDLLPNLKPGLYVMTADPENSTAEEWADKATQWFVVSDFGLTAMTGADGVHGAVRSLATGRGVEGVELRLIARNNEVLGETRTDAQGYARFDAGLARGAGGLAPALLVARGAENDYGFLDLAKSAFDLTDRGVGGRRAPGALDAMLFTERGVYRPGEKLYLTALLRDGEARASQAPLTVKILRPDGVEHKAELLADAGAGGRTLTLPLPETAMTGTWRIAAYADPKALQIGETSFLVEDYTPERLEMTLTPKSEEIAADAPSNLALTGRYLYGAPAANLTLEGETVVSARLQGLAAYPGFSFGLDTESFAPVRQPLANLPNTNAAGEAALNVNLPALAATTRPLEARTTIRMREPSGRVIEESVTLPVKQTGPLIGIRPAFGAGSAPQGAPAEFEIVATGPGAKQIEMKGLKWELFKLESRFQWYSRDGRWDYEPVEYIRKTANGVIDASASSPAALQITAGYGAYRLEVTGPGGAAASLKFSAGWYVSEVSDTPDILELALDKEKYLPGEALKVRILPRMAGEAVVSIVSDKLLATQTVAVGEAGGEAAFTVDPAWGPGAYVTAILYRPMDANAKRMPGRAIGVKWLTLDASARSIAVSLGAPAKARPNERLTMPVKVTGLGAGEKAYVVVAAVDAGILNLTNYKAPDLSKHYAGQRALGAEFRDLYGSLIDGMQGARGAIRSGGDGGISLNGRPLSSEPVALFSGLVEIPQSGEVEVGFDVPAFDGTLRIMASAWSADKVGQGGADVIIRDPVIITATPPRFLTIGDKAQMHVSLHNVEAAPGEFELAASVEGGLLLEAPAPRKLSLGAGERVSLSLPLSGEALGKSRIALALSGPDGFKAERVFKLDINPAAPNVTRRMAQTIAAKTGALTLSESLIADFIPGTAKVTVSAGPGAAFDVPGILLSLDRYPYGCAEQTISRALPLLYFNEVAEAAGVAGEAGAKDRIAKAIERLAGLQGSNGSFGLWSAGDDDLWLTAYAADFLTRAKEQNHAVPPAMLEVALDRLKNSVNRVEEFEKGGEELAYALYVLARSGRAVIGDLRYYADEKIAAFATPLAQAQIGGALAMYGDKERAERVFAAALASLRAAPDNALIASRTDFGAALRDSAATLTLVSESGAAKSAVPGLAETVSRLRSLQPYGSTQENAWLLLAAKALIDDVQGLSLEVNGAPQKGQVQRTLSGADLAAAPLTVKNLGAQAIPATIIVSGASAAPEPASANGFTIERQVYTPDGKTASLAKAKQNERFVVVLKVAEAEAKLGHIIIDDRLPAGFEIENPKLLQSADLKAFSWLKADLTPAHTQFRDDRFVAAYSFSDAERDKPAELTLAYTLRAVTPGSYTHPGAVVEDMYRPGRFARSAPAMAEVTRQ